MTQGDVRRWRWRLLEEFFREATGQLERVLFLIELGGRRGSQDDGAAEGHGDTSGLRLLRQHRQKSLALDRGPERGDPHD